MPLTKDIFRKKCFARLKSTPSYTQKVRDIRLNAMIIKRLKSIRHKNILVYNSLVFEANIHKSINYLRKKCKIYTPFMEGKSFKIVPYRLPLKKNRFNIYEAGNSFREVKRVDIAIVPVVGVDVNMQRVGFGKGMYDRFFAKLKKRPYTIFTQSRLCYTDKKVCDGYDIHSDVLITPYAEVETIGHKNIGKKDVNRRTSWKLHSCN